ncbi:unnamed protein product, partial [marine sediment metagenome]
MIPFHILKLALRYLKTKWVVYISVAAVAVSVGSIIFVMSVQDWLIETNRRSIRGILSDLTVRTDDFKGFADYRRLRRDILAVPGVLHCTPTLEIKAVAGHTLPNGVVIQTPCTVVGIEIRELVEV